MIYHRSYRHTKRVAYTETDADLFLYKVKGNIDLLCPTLKPFSAFKEQRISGGLATRALGFFLTGSAQTYKNMVYPNTHDPNPLPVTWPLIVQYLLRCFITDDLLPKITIR